MSNSKEGTVSDPTVLDDPFADAVVDADDIATQPEDDDPESLQGEPVVIDLIDDADGGK
jgi:hypothetical protein